MSEFRFQIGQRVRIKVGDDSPGTEEAQELTGELGIVLSRNENGETASPISEGDVHDYVVLIDDHEYDVTEPWLEEA